MDMLYLKIILLIKTIYLHFDGALDATSNDIDSLRYQQTTFQIDKPKKELQPES